MIREGALFLVGQNILLALLSQASLANLSMVPIRKLGGFSYKSSSTTEIGIL